ncbi:MAG TPA: acyloxyacyl hydrolase [Thermoanaerobaculia bacterium]|nr:acyloxyacyl hydrolase [Thermoanaerobaculia bacterium]
MAKTEQGARQAGRGAAAALLTRQVAVALALLAGLAMARAAGAQTTAVAAFGVFGPEPGEQRAAVLDLQFRFTPRWWRIAPALGAGANSRGGTFVYAGLSRDFPFAGRWNANVTEAAAFYTPGNSKRLGRGIEFRSALEVGFLASSDVRIGLTVAHLSNAGIGDRNPGVETFTATIAWVPGRGVGRR